jgi:hypothetical protein
MSDQQPPPNPTPATTWVPTCVTFEDEVTLRDGILCLRDRIFSMLPANRFKRGDKVRVTLENLTTSIDLHSRERDARIEELEQTVTELNNFDVPQELVDARLRDAALRLDERQACWEDVVHVVRQAIKDSPGSFDLKALHEAIYVQGWKDFGTGDGKPQHKRKDSAVNEWTAALAARKGSLR